MVKLCLLPVQYDYWNILVKMGVFSHMHTGESGTQYYMDCNYAAQVLPITIYILGK